ncbi:MAG TPA: hypothetical protein VFE61_14075 [Candidatus Sulfotelmatobacter sp.]|nr:hypothetical protein [Candidatus Sulfotelmatobacter sp.]
MKAKNAFLVTFLCTVIGTAAAVPSPANFSAAAGQTSDAAQPAIAKSIGTIKAINGNRITLSPQSGPEIAVTVAESARILRLAPGEKDLKSATPISVQDLQVGDAIRVRGPGAADAKSINALEVILITRSAVAAVGDQIRQDWQKRGLGGVVTAVDAASGTITISVTGFAGTKTFAVHTAKNTVIRRYAPDSVKFEDAKPSTLQDIHTGDQLRARGNRSADGSEVAADEVVTGKFPYVEGTVKSVDASAGTLSVQDVLSKKTVQVKITADSQLHKIPTEMAQRFAARIRGAVPPGIPGAAPSQSAPNSPAAASGSSGQSAQTGAASGGKWQGSGAGGAAAGGMGGGARAGGAPDFQQLLSRLPASTLADLNLQKGDAVIILATEGTPSGGSTAITLLSGVEPILQAAPSGSQAMMLAPWSLGATPGGDAATQ